LLGSVGNPVLVEAFKLGMQAADFFADEDALGVCSVVLNARLQQTAVHQADPRSEDPLPEAFRCCFEQVRSDPSNESYGLNLQLPPVADWLNLHADCDAILQTSKIHGFTEQRAVTDAGSSLVSSTNMWATPV
jgi:hypothetical protein